MEFVIELDDFRCSKSEVVRWRRERRGGGGGQMGRLLGEEPRLRQLVVGGRQFTQWAAMKGGKGGETHV